MNEAFLPSWLSILPPLVAIGLALLLRRVIASLLFGVCMGVLIAERFAPWEAFKRLFDTYLWETLAHAGHLRILAFALLLGGLMRVLNVSGGAFSFAERVTRWASTRRSGQLVCWLLGVVFFFDDYANTLFVGSSMRPVIDRLRISREKLAFVVDATAAPIASIAPLSSWIVVELGYIADQYATLGLEGDPYRVFLQTIPLRFYPLLMLAFGFMVAVSDRDFGPMAHAEQRALDSEPAELPEAAATPGVVEGMPAGKRGWLTAVVPLAVAALAIPLALVIDGYFKAKQADAAIDAANLVAYGSSSVALLVAAGAAGLVGIVMAVSRQALSLGRALTAWLRGMRHMSPVVAVLILAWMLGAVTQALGTAEYLVQVLGESFTPGLLPALVFVLSALVSFGTGTSWGAMGILFPMALPLAHALAPGDEELMLGTVASILAGSVFGDHCSPISDTTIMSALASECHTVDHVRTQLPYALCVGAIALGAGIIPVAMDWWNIPVALALGLALNAGLLWGWGRVPRSRRPAQDSSHQG